MSPVLNIDAVAKLMVEELTGVCGARLGGEATSAPTDVPTTQGWTLALPVSGAADGRLTVWFDHASAAAFARAVSAAEETPADDVVANLLMELARDAAAAVNARPEGAGLLFGEPEAGQGRVANGARAFYIAVPNTASCLLAVGVERAAAIRGAEDRMDAVLDVDLPLVVRFGRTVMPLHAIAELGPGSVIDMGRSPEEPVDLLVGERLIARGEVVVVGGNYGVRITQLAAGRETAAIDKETRAL